MWGPRSENKWVLVCALIRRESKNESNYGRPFFLSVPPLVVPRSTVLELNSFSETGESVRRLFVSRPSHTNGNPFSLLGITLPPPHPSSVKKDLRLECCGGKRKRLSGSAGQSINGRDDLLFQIKVLLYLNTSGITTLTQ
jgi:hypothetical protein